MSETTVAEAPPRPWYMKLVELIEAISNMFFYLFAFFIIIIPPLKWMGDWFDQSTSSWAVAGAAIVFGIFVPSIISAVADRSMTLMEKIRKGAFLGVIFRPLRAVCAVISIYGILALEYSVIHSDSGKSVLEVYFELLKAL